MEHDPVIRTLRIRSVPARVTDANVISQSVRDAVAMVAATTASVVGVLIDLRGVQYTERSDFLVAALAEVWSELVAHAPRLAILGRHPELPQCDDAMVHDTEAGALAYLLGESRAA